MSRKNEGLRLDFNSAYKSFRNRFRPFRPVSVLRAALTYLHQPSPDTYHDLQKIPWQVLLLVKWVCQDAMTSDRTGRDITATEFDALRQYLWELPEVTELGIRETLPHYLFMRQLLRPQVGFQRRTTAGFVREAALLAAQPENAALQILFREKAGLAVRDFLDLSLAAFAAMTDGRRVLPLSWFEPLHAKYGAPTIVAFASVLSRDYAGLNAFFRSLPDGNRRVASEYFEFPAIARYPFLLEGNQLVSWHPMVFHRGLEGMVHAVLSEAGQEYMDAFSKLFEAHVTSEARKIPAPYLGEAELLGLVPPQTQVPDALLSYPDCNVYIESKANLFDESVMVVGHNEMFARKTKFIRKAISQAWSAATQLRSTGRAPAQVLAAPKDYLLIVTNKDLSAGRGSVLAGIYPEGTLAYPDAEAERFLPLENIYVLTIEEFERVVAAARMGTIELPTLLQDCVAADQNPETASYYFEQHLEARRLPRACSEVIERAIEEAEERLRVALGDQDRNQRVPLEPAVATALAFAN